jgi:hypothetical protein
MNRFVAALAVTGAIVGQSSITYAQQPSTVGDILDKGGKRLTKEEVQRLYSGATVSGVQGADHPETTFKNTYSTSGSVTGDAWRNGTWFSKISGSWSANDSGQLCSDLTTSQGGKIAGCAYYFSLGGHYYSARAVDRSTPVNERQFGR